MKKPLEITDPKLCGLGDRERCCAFLVVGHAWLCGRTFGVAHHIRDRLAAGTMNAKYDPGTTPYPECQAKCLSQLPEKGLDSSAFDISSGV